MIEFKKIWVKITLLCILGIGATFFGWKEDVQAASLLEDLAITETETEGDFAEDTEYSRTRGNDLNFGHSVIRKLASNKVSIYSLTQGHHECDTVYLTVYLERKENGSYYTYKYWDFSANNVSDLSKSIEVIVPSGTFYRVRATHATVDGGNVEAVETLTNGVLID